MVASQAQSRGELGSGVTERSDRSRSRTAKRTAPVKPVSSNQSRIQLLWGGKAIESPATHVAREAFDLPGEGNQRQANQQHRWQQPQAGSLKAGVERMGQSQPEAELHRQWQQ